MTYTRSTHSKNGQLVSRRNFVKATSGLMFGSLFLPGMSDVFASNPQNRIQPCGPASTYIPSLKVAFVRRKEEYGMWWPGQIYDGKTAYKHYKEQILKTGEELGVKIDLRSEPIYSLEEGEQWVSEAKAQNPDGLLVVTLDRQQHTWPTVNKAIETGLPIVVFSPIGSSFTTNTAKPSKKNNVYICSTDDFSQVAYGMKMIKAGAKLRETRFLIIKGDERKDLQLAHFGTKCRYIPAQDFIDEYNRIPTNQEVKALAKEYINNAKGVKDATTQDIYNGVKSYLVARNLLKREECDGISMDCLGALGRTEISLPCIAWSKMNDHQIPAACEADLGACVTHALVQYLFDRPGFQQDPVAETSRDCLIGAHCSCPTKLNGFAEKEEPYTIMNHHGKRDATPHTEWKLGQEVTVADIVSVDNGTYGNLEVSPAGEKKQKMGMLISTGQVVDNVSVPPAGGCVVSVMVELDGVSSLLDYPGFHQLFFYGDFKKKLTSYCHLFGIEPVVI